MGQGHAQQRPGALHHPPEKKPHDKHKGYVHQRPVAHVQHGKEHRHVGHRPPPQGIARGPLQQATKNQLLQEAGAHDQDQRRKQGAPPAQLWRQWLRAQDIVLRRAEEQAAEPHYDLERPAAQGQAQPSPGVAQAPLRNPSRGKERHAGDEVPEEDGKMGQRQ